MEHDVKPAPEPSELHPVWGYEPPRIEMVLTPEALGREGLYAGITPQIQHQHRLTALKET
jgi:hypothetical protein